MDLIEGLDIGPYRLVTPAGAGGMAEVWRAYDVRLERYVAIKFLSPRYAADPDYLERFLREARSVSRLDHPNILTVYDFGEQENWTYMVSPFIGGGTLAARLRRGPWSTQDAIRVLEPLASALDYAHGEGLVHRDIKPSNVLFTTNDRLILSDFGIARMVEGSTMLSQTGLVIGTPMYMSPEQANGDRAEPASDRYSFGVVAYEMLTGRPPFQAETPMAMLLAHIQKPLPPPRTVHPGISDAAEGALFKMLAKAPTDRYGSTAQFVDALRRAATTPPAAATRETGGVPAPVDQRRFERAGEAPSASQAPVRPETPQPAASASPPAAQTPPPGIPPRVPAPPSTPIAAPGLGVPAASIPTTPQSTAATSARTEAAPTPGATAALPSGRVPRPPDGTRMARLRELESEEAHGVSRRKLLLGLGAAGIAGIGLMAYLSDRSPGAAARATPTPVLTWAAPAGAAKPAPATAAEAKPTGKRATVPQPKELPPVGSALTSNVVFSPDGQNVAYGGAGGDVQIMGFPNGNGVRSMTGHTMRVLSVAFSGDGQLLVSGAYDTMVKLWRVADGSQIWNLKTTGHVLSVAVSPDGQTVAATTSDLKEFRLWRATDGTEIRKLEGHQRYVSTVAFSPDGKTVASGSEDATVRLWNVADGALLRTLEHSSPVESLTFTRDGKTLLSGADDGTARLWRVADGSQIRLLASVPGGETTGSVSAVAFAPDGQTAAGAVTNVGTVLWRIADGSRIATLADNGMMQLITNGGLAYAPDGRTLVTVQLGNRGITVWPLS